jgi:hypothetical protein
MEKLNKNKVGLVIGVFLAFFHLVWALAVAIIPSILQKLLDWIFNIHFLEPVWKLTSFNLMGTIELVIFTFVVGYIIGWVFVLIHNKFHKSK